MPRAVPSHVRLVTTVFVALAATGCMVGPNYARPPLAPPPQFRFAEGAQAESLADAPWFQIFDDPSLQNLIKEAIANNLDLEGRRGSRGRSTRPRGNSGNLPLSTSRRRRELWRAAGVERPEGRRLSRTRTRRTRVAPTAFSCRGSSISSAASAARGNLRWRWPRHRAGAARRHGHAGRRRRVELFLLRELDVQLEIARRTLGLNDETVAYFRNRLDGGVSNRLELDRIIANRAQTAAAIPDIEQRDRGRGNAISMLLGRPPSAITRTAIGPEGTLVPPIPAGLARLCWSGGRTSSRRSNCWSRPTPTSASPSRSLSHDQPHRFSRRGQRRSDDRFSAATARSGRSRPGLFQPIFQAGRLRRNAEAVQARFNAALAEYQKAALNSYREVANSLVTIQKLAEVRVQRQEGVTALTDASDLARSRYDSGLASYHRDPHGRSGVVPSRSCCWRRRADPSCARARTLSNPAAAGSLSRSRRRGESWQSSKRRSS